MQLIKVHEAAMNKTHVDDNFLAKNDAEPKRFLSAQARRVHVKAYQVSGESIIAYCEKHHLALSTFKSWVRKYGEKKISPAFIPVIRKTTDKTEEAAPIHCQFRNVEIHLNGIKVVISEVIDFHAFTQFIKGLSDATNTVKKPVYMDL